MSRMHNIDLLKIIAIFMVIMLHVNGYFRDTIGGFNNMPIVVNIVWHIFEIIAIPAIHIFVLISAYFFTMNKPNAKSVINIYSQTYVVCVIGMILALANGVSSSVIDWIRCVIPFIGRAYWFVSDYLMYCLIVPYLNFVINGISYRNLFRITMVGIVIVSILRTVFIPFGWHENTSHLELFILLHFIMATLKYNINLLSNRKLGCVLWGGTVVFQLIAWFGIDYLFGVKFSEKIFMYSNPLIIIQAIALFMVFYNIKITSMYIKDKISSISQSSLIIYLVHMHPIIKHHYVEWNLLGWIYADYYYYYIACYVLACIIVFIFGYGISKVVLKISKKITAFINNTNLSSNLDKIMCATKG